MTMTSLAGPTHLASDLEPTRAVRQKAWRRPPSLGRPQQHQVSVGNARAVVTRAARISTGGLSRSLVPQPLSNDSYRRANRRARLAITFILNDEAVTIRRLDCRPEIEASNGVRWHLSTLLGCDL